MVKPLPDLKQQLRQLVASPSISATDPALDMGNRGVVELLAVWLETLGFNVELMPIANQPQKVNMIATLGRGDGGLVLAGHTDTVPFDEGRWQTDPFELVERDNRLYGLGATDMKGFFPIAIEAAKTFSDKPLRQPLIVLATADEETSMAGARALVKAGRPKARYAVVGEPTGLKPVYTHKGAMMEAVRITGQSGHSSNPALGANALEAMHTAIGELLKLRGEWQQRYHNPGFAVPVPTMNLGCIHGGDNPNRICGHVELQFDIRPLPGMALTDLRAELQQRLHACIEDEKIKLDYAPLFAGTEAFEQDIHSELVKTAEKLTGNSAESVAFATEAPYLKSMGMDTIVLGPGDINQAHQPDEFLGLERIEPMVSILRGLIARFCL
ncbi:acetylornithine deacetylase [Microbulbifer thermotolerans]|uniref:Acetylornithine deacetylase n=1 Tax=Microbulbifer thermotolerans TaxID=252514 RepID=A0A143HP74_MICTH|nr:acetylornithine deacetylase [Microbulbifer thermotolerans]AMX03534.1 acetylornithine deacetylase [Microbulbifer thermotolerans]MCX2782209.1 acetylornithine deacetylase [Microbulbifer thermotolerans]MCX2801137.1 acetylornithine deacetylase [Microbulbifer thermotolerans]MCX2831286.1 acetylornithine deacetylase [Microbulbifer thermotolerans]MCX2835212.1 acetylornithine deacetylase [Microbulbifer thermotolerans]